MDDDEFLTIDTSGEAQMRVMASRFLGFAFSAHSQEEFEKTLESVRKERYDATHWCWAFRLWSGASLIERSSDAGEPHGSAGLPILREIQSCSLIDTAVIVTRYFGGTKLGTGNLGRAYGECAAAALAAARHVKRTIYEVLRVDSSFDDQSIVYHWSRQTGVLLEPIASSERALFDLKVRRRSVESLRQHLIDDSSGRISVQEAGRWIA